MKASSPIAQVARADRERLLLQKSAVLWFTGLSAAGKSSSASALEKALHDRGLKTYLIDGDVLRDGLCKDLSFTRSDRAENIRRAGEVAKHLVEAGIIVLAAFISPYRAERQLVRDLFKHNEFIEIYVKASLETCESRDPKGLYKKAREGELELFTGVDSEYEPPVSPEITLDTEALGQQEVANFLLERLHELKLVQQ